MSQRTITLKALGATKLRKKDGVSSTLVLANSTTTSMDGLTLKISTSHSTTLLSSVVVAPHLGPMKLEEGECVSAYLPPPSMGNTDTSCKRMKVKDSSPSTPFIALERRDLLERVDRDSCSL
ncbi:hypothetical protein BVRB_3g069350 [Beta vulgaris subsp. vulgaris]|nr:hypothetical protein BVRB_3g069350 [Beta vulgaris subsp. vulgaris]